MANMLVLPDGVSLVENDGFLQRADPDRQGERVRVEDAHIAPGYRLLVAQDAPFAYFAEVNVDAPQVWTVFRHLCEALLGRTVGLLISQVDFEPETIGVSNKSVILRMLAAHQYQLAHDGFVQFGLAETRDGRLTEVFVAPVKYIQVWLNDVNAFRSVMAEHGLAESEQMEFVDQYVRMTTALEGDNVRFASPADMIEHFRKALSPESGGREGTGPDILH